MSEAEGTADLTARIDVIEEAYEFFLAYASQGLPSDADNDTGRQAREYLKRCDGALANFGDFLRGFVTRLGIEPAAPYFGFIKVVEADAQHARAALQLVLAQPAIGSQIIDNLNASIHLRALLTDLFLIDEVLKARR